MTIPANLFAQVLPSVLSPGGGATNLNALMITENTRVPIGTVAQFSGSAAVGSFFGLGSQEYAEAVQYFAGFNNASATPGEHLFAQYPAVAVTAYLQSGNVGANLTLAQLQALSGTLTVVMDGYSRTANAVNLSSITSYSNAATTIATALNASLPQEAAMTGSIGSGRLTVTALSSGFIAAGQTLSGSLGGTVIAAGTLITSQISGSIGGTVNNVKTTSTNSGGGGVFGAGAAAQGGAGFGFGISHQ